ncbi:MAG: glucosamine-6-phosphate isomerase [Tissierellia bacterium]|nr:glucosamine-6-phosphate isomerase [Tissierellia bacterium]
MDYFKKTREDLISQNYVKVEIGNVFEKMADAMIEEINKNNENNENTVFIIPVGPTGQYPVFVKRLNAEEISLKNTYFINMDEYMANETDLISPDDKLSFVKFMNEEFYDKIDEKLRPDEDHRIFPQPENPDAIGELIDKLGGVDICFGGIGITGHVAFNEPCDMPVEEFKNLKTRVIEIGSDTRVVNSIGALGGAIIRMPKYAISLGFKEIFGAKKVILGVFRDWHRAVARQVIYREISSQFPATILREHPDFTLIIDENAAKCPY